MKISEILRQDVDIQKERIWKQPATTLAEVFQNPEKMSKKVLVFLNDLPKNLLRGGMTIRKFAYIPKEQTWIVSDQNLLTGLEEFYETHFNSKEFQEYFNWMFDRKGYLFDKK